MKILCIGNFGFGWDGSICDEEHIAKALEDLGHEVIRWQREGVTSGQVNMPSGDFDFTLIAQWHGYPIDLSKLPRPLIFWAFDLQEWGQDWCERLIAEADLYLSKRIADSKYPNWRWLSQDFAPDFLLPKHSIEQDIDVLFTGSYLPWATERNETLKAIDDTFNLVIHSVNDWPGFKDVRPPIMDEGLPELYGRAKVILSIDHTLEAGYWSDRNAQIIACGRKPLFRYVPLSEVRFGERVAYFYNTEDCLEKINNQLDSPMYEERTGGLYVKDRVKDLLTIVESIL
jgi:hypothetical protein